MKSLFVSITLSSIIALVSINCFAYIGPIGGSYNRAKQITFAEFKLGVMTIQESLSKLNGLCKFSAEETTVNGMPGLLVVTTRGGREFFPADADYDHFWRDGVATEGVYWATLRDYSDRRNPRTINSAVVSYLNTPTWARLKVQREGYSHECGSQPY